jgi:hypothetical protein
MSSNVKTAFQNVEVVVAAYTDPSTGKQGYRLVSATPQPVVITKPNTIVNFELVAPSPAEARFTGMSISPENSQFSKPTISTDGKNMTVSDVNTQWGNFTRTFEINGEPAPPMISPAPATLVAVDAPPTDLENRP